MANLKLEGLKKSFAQVEVIRGVDLDIADGEFVVFVGPSGCGKSTILRLISGLEEMTDGRILIDGHDVSHTPPSKREIAMVFQSYALFPHMTVARNIGFGLHLARTAKAEINKRVTEVARTLQIESLLQRKPRELSGGQRQRVAIGRSIIRNPKVFLFDEPLSNLDATLRVQMRVELAHLHRNLETTMLYVTHDQTEAMTLADRIVVFNKGKIEQVGTPMELYHHPANLFVAGFIGAPAMNFLHCEHRNNKVVVGNCTFPVDDRTGVGQAHTLGIRPEHLELADSTDGFPARVDLIEKLGGETLVHAKINDSGKVVVLKLSGEAKATVGSHVRIRCATEHLHFFDQQGYRV